MNPFKRHNIYIVLALVLFLVEVLIALTLKTGFIRHTFGDVLASIFVYCLLRGFTKLSINKSAFFSICIAFGLEFLQLTPFLKMLHLEQYKIARIVFGTTFHLSDLVAYTVGILSVLIIENKGLRFKGIHFKHRFFKRKMLLKIMSVSLICLLFLPNIIVAKTAENRTFYDIKKLPKNKVGLVLGAGKFTGKGNINPYYWNRIKAAVELYKSGKIEYILASGDNGIENYNEPAAFKNDLIALGVPGNRIVLDYAGFRTLDSVLRAKEVFGLEHFTVISQRYHNQRAVYLAQQHGIKAVGYNAKHVIKKGFFNKPFREYLARTKAVIDIIINTQPKFYGDKIKIG